MRPIAVHLVSPPWAPPHAPSIQTGALKAYLDSVYPADAVTTTAYPAFYSILIEASDGAAAAFFNQYSGFGEVLFQLLYARRFGLPGVSAGADNDLLDRIANSEYSGFRRVTAETLDALERASVSFVTCDLRPQLPAGTMNVVGFTMNYDQVYSSLFLARLLIEEPADAEIILLFGGASAALSNTRRVLQALGIRAWCVSGEGEPKLATILTRLLALNNAGRQAVGEAMESVPGVFCAAGRAAADSDGGCASLQLDNIDELPPPDYADYFRLNPQCERRSVVLEGSRGCFGRCDFCGLNSQWLGFRKKRPHTVIRQAIELCERYGASDVQFVDNVCDTWALEYATELARRGIRLSGFMELRASHPEAFWTRLALAGIDRVQIGTEALSPPLLAAIGKGTRVFHNIAAQKYLRELGIEVSGMIMGYHPHSTLDDIAETKRILEAIPHLGPFGLTRYRVSQGSPLHNRLTDRERENLQTFITHPVSPEFDALQVGCWFQPPQRLGPPIDVCVAWEEFRSWYLNFLSRPETSSASLTVKTCAAGQMTIRDSRWGRAREVAIEGDAARVYELCHTARQLTELSAITGLDDCLLRRYVEELLDERWLLASEGRLIAIALRGRAVLVENLLTEAEWSGRRSTQEWLELQQV